MPDPESQTTAAPVISRAASKDAPAILALQRLSYQSEAAIYDDYAIAPLTETLAELEADIKRIVVLKAEAGDRLVGSVRGRLADHTILVGRLAVAPDCQNLGLGRRLMSAIEEFFPQAVRCELFTGYKSEKNLTLHTKLGYREARRAPVHPGLTLVYMEKAL